MSAGTPYYRLPGRSGLFISHSLWMSADHVLSVRRNPFSESYRRYYFTDIQAIVLTELPNVMAPYGYTTGALFVATAAALSYTQHPVWAILCGLIALVTLWLSWRSADCACYLQTTVSSEMLPSLRKQGTAGKTLAIIKAQIEKAQGAVSAEALEAVPADTRARQVAPPKSALRHCTGRLHWIVFALMVMRGALSSSSLLGVVSVPLNLAAGGLGTVVLLLLVLAAIQQRNSDLAVDVRRVIYASLVFYIASGLAGFVVSIYVAFRLGQQAANRSMLLANPAIRFFELLDLIGFCALGLAGLFFLWRHQRSSAPPSIELGTSA
ncbi:MAG TPA: hypothetical protein VKT81_18905 [Bryobacteraceae bacterium]|nr:hypothetical protein [Bryobacteraceae bacterium]